jgi:hypothetical protein
MKTFNVLLLAVSFIIGFGLIYVGNPITIGVAFAILLSCAIYSAVSTFVNTNKMVEHKTAPTIKQSYESLSNGSPKTAMEELLA